jgi:hypothetical protein
MTAQLANPQIVSNVSLSIHVRMGSADYVCSQGTDEEWAVHNTTILTDGGTPPCSWGISVSPITSPDEEGRRPVWITSSGGSPGLEVHIRSAIQYQGGQFYVCNAMIQFGSAIAIFYREDGDGIPGECVDVELMTHCVHDATVHEFARESRCLV